MALVMLCVEDEPTGEQLSAALTCSGHTVVTRPHGSDALGEALEDGFDVVVISLDASSSTRTQQSANELMDSAILIGLHHDPSQVMCSAGNLGVRAVLPRPVLLPSFMSAIERFVEQRRLKPAV